MVSDKERASATAAAYASSCVPHCNTSETMKYAAVPLHVVPRMSPCHPQWLLYYPDCTALTWVLLLAPCALPYTC